MKQLKVAVVNTFDVKDIKNWSGIPFHISIMLESVFGKKNLNYVIISLKRSWFSYLKGFYFNRVRRKNYLSWADENLLLYNKKAFDVIEDGEFDLIITFQSFLIPNFKTKKSKVILWTDATFKNLLNFYDYVSNLCNYTLNGGNALQKKALQISNAIIFSSQWAINTAVQDYAADPQKVHLIPFSSNLNTFPGLEEINEIINHRSTGILKLLFLGVDWERKGGDMAVDVVNNLNKKGIKAILYVVGTGAPIAYEGNKNIISLGFINKNEAAGEKEIIKLLKDCSFLILPTKADCTPVAFSEANSYGLPVITTNVGGITSVIVNNFNGACFKSEIFVEDATTFIEKSWASLSGYRALCFTSYKYFNDELSWKIVEEKFKAVLSKIIF